MSRSGILSRRSLLSSGVAAAGASVASQMPAATAQASSWRDRLPLWLRGARSGIVYGSSTATWQMSDQAYRRLFEREAGILGGFKGSMQHRVVGASVAGR